MNRLRENEILFCFGTMENKEELIIKESEYIIPSDCYLKFGSMKKEFRVIVDH